MNIDAWVADASGLVTVLVGLGAFFQWRAKRERQRLVDLIDDRTRQLRPNGGSHVADLPKKMEELRHELLEAVGETNERVARIEGSMDILMTLVSKQTLRKDDGE
jgi:uncharacterized protein YjeT (DUF2065 family)